MPNISILSGVLIGEILELNYMKSYTGCVKSPVEIRLSPFFLAQNASSSKLQLLLVAREYFECMCKSV